MTDELTMTDGQRLLRRILDNPEDDAPRLILSDWLEDNGEEERARFIRSQVFLSRNDNPPPCSKPEDCYYANRCQHNCGVVDRDRVCEPHWKIVRDLFDKHKCEWFGESWAILYLDSEREDADGQYEGMSKAFVGRGFISEIHLACDQFCGGPCRRCEVYELRTDPDCNQCGGTGHIDGVARELFLAHPIVRVVLTDARPDFHMTADIDYFNWFGLVVPQGPLPQELIDLLPNRGYEHREEALAALADACVAWGRSLVGLPPLADNSDLQ